MGQEQDIRYQLTFLELTKIQGLNLPARKNEHIFFIERFNVIKDPEESRHREILQKAPGVLSQNEGSAKKIRKTFAIVLWKQISQG